MSKSPQVLMLAGPNGAGKSTSASVLVRSKASFVNADDIARDLPDTDRDHAEMKAGRLALSMLDRLAGERQDFAIETTLASRTLAPRIRALKASEYEFQLIFFWLPSPELAIKRVESRVRMGGHDIPENTIRRRYVSGLANFFERYQPIADVWRVYANTNLKAPVLVAEGRLLNTIHIYDHEIWEQMQAAYGEEKMNGAALVEPMTDSASVTGEIALAVRQALAENQARMNPVAIWEEGQVKIVKKYP